MHRVATITPVRNDAAGLPHAVASILAQRDVEIERIVLAVGPSDDDSAEVAATLAAEHERVVVVDNPSGRTPSALNAAIAATSAEVVVRVDARAVLPPSYVAHALETLDATAAGNVGAVQRPVGATPVERAIAAAMRSRFGSGGVAYRNASEAQPVDTAWLGVFRRTALDDVGGYDDDFIRNQDAELNIRLNRAGHQVWLDPRLVVDYTPRGSLRALARQYYQYGWWRQRTVRKHRGSLALRQLAAPVILVGVVGGTVGAVLVHPIGLVAPLGYGAAVLAVGLGGEGGVDERLLTAASLATMHLSWGTGFLLSAARSARQRGST